MLAEDVDRPFAGVAGDLHPVVAHLLQEIVGCLSGSAPVAARRADEDADFLRFLHCCDDAADAVEIDLAMLVVGLAAPADVVDAVGDGERRVAPCRRRRAEGASSPPAAVSPPQPALMKRTLRRGNRSSV